jgi:hypothetical protein
MAMSESYYSLLSPDHLREVLDQQRNIYKLVLIARDLGRPGSVLNDFEELRESLHKWNDARSLGEPLTSAIREACEEGPDEVG